MRAIRRLVATVMLSGLAGIATVGASVAPARADGTQEVTAYITQSGPLFYGCATVPQTGNQVCVEIPSSISVPIPTPPDYIRAFVTQTGNLLRHPGGQLGRLRGRIGKLNIGLRPAQSNWGGTQYA